MAVIGGGDGSAGGKFGVPRDLALDLVGASRFAARGARLYAYPRLLRVFRRKLTCEV